MPSSRVSSVSNRPLTLLVAAVAVALEGLTALLLGGYVAVETVVGRPEDIATSIGVAVFGVGVGAGLLWVAWGLLRGERWSRGPGVVTQIFAVPVVITLFQSERLVMGLALAAVVAVALIGLLAPPTTAVLYHDEERGKR
ncbi:hypothetical protein SAMN05421505_13125 [Sinosporangium album]|uniref:Integral membrane protein n=1 Tax=Sinosporangium album TaxID=504805 RepID=A0A1G8H986_9ACTN|nr:hypothetical protein SAMN05421505_13125 [Sinosporangium album]